MAAHGHRPSLTDAGRSQAGLRDWAPDRVYLRSAALAVALAAVLALTACQTRTVVVTQEVTREVPVTVVVTPDEGLKLSATPEPASGGDMDLRRQR